MMKCIQIFSYYSYEDVYILRVTETLCYNKKNLTPGQSNGTDRQCKTYQSYRKKDDEYRMIGKAQT